MGRRTAFVAALAVVGAAVLVLRVRVLDVADGPGVLDVADVEPATVGFHTVDLPGGLRHEPLAVGNVLVSYTELPRPRPPADHRV